MRFLAGVVALLLLSATSLVTATPLAAASYSSFKFSHDGKRIIAIGPKPSELSVWEVKQPGQRKTISFPGRTIDIVLVAGAVDKVAIRSEKERDYYLNLIDIRSMEVEYELSKGKKDKGVRYKDPTFLAEDGSRVYFAAGANNAVADVEFDGGKERSYSVSPPPYVNAVVDKSHAIGVTGAVWSEGFSLVNFRKDEKIYKTTFGCFTYKPVVAGPYLAAKCKPPTYDLVKVYDLRSGDRVSTFNPIWGDWMFETRGDYIIYWEDPKEFGQEYQIIDPETGRTLKTVGFPAKGSHLLAAWGKVLVIRLRDVYGLYDVETGKHIGDLATD